MPVQIDKDAKIGNNNAIGDNASVRVNERNHGYDKNNNKIWFAKHPWLSAIICSLIASIILLLNWKKIFSFVSELFG